MVSGPSVTVNRLTPADAQLGGGELDVRHVHLGQRGDLLVVSDAVSSDCGHTTTSSTAAGTTPTAASPPTPTNRSPLPPSGRNARTSDDTTATPEARTVAAATANGATSVGRTSSNAKTW